MNGGSRGYILQWDKLKGGFAKRRLLPRCSSTPMPATTPKMLAALTLEKMMVPTERVPGDIHEEWRAQM